MSSVATFRVTNFTSSQFDRDVSQYWLTFRLYSRICLWLVWSLVLRSRRVASDKCGAAVSNGCVSDYFIVRGGLDVSIILLVLSVLLLVTSANEVLDVSRALWLLSRFPLTVVVVIVLCSTSVFVGGRAGLPVVVLKDISFRPGHYFLSILAAPCWPPGFVLLQRFRRCRFVHFLFACVLISATFFRFPCFGDVFPSVGLVTFPFFSLWRGWLLVSFWSCSF